MTATANQGEIKTFTASVPAWEIDANGHWSTMFYLAAFEAASVRYALAVQGKEGPEPPKVFHLRFFRELRLLDTQRVVSVGLSAERGPYTVGHEMRHGVTGRPVAWALELRGDAPAAVSGPAMEGEYAPRSLVPGPDAPVDSAASLAQANGAISHVGILSREDVAAYGGLRMAAIQSHLSDGNAHLWQHSGVMPGDFYGHGLGRANVEMKLTRHAGRPAGTPVRLVSWFAEIGRKSFQVRHQLEDLTSGVALASVATVALVIDLERRKAAELPDNIAAALRR